MGPVAVPAVPTALRLLGVVAGWTIRLKRVGLRVVVVVVAWRRRGIVDVDNVCT